MHTNWVKERTKQGSRDRERTILKAKRVALPVGFVQCKSRANRGEFLAKMLAVFTHRTSHIAPQRPEVFVPCLRIVAMPQRTVLTSPASSPPPKLSLSLPARACHHLHSKYGFCGQNQQRSIQIFCQFCPVYVLLSLCVCVSVCVRVCTLLYIMREFANVNSHWGTNIIIIIIILLRNNNSY